MPGAWIMGWARFVYVTGYLQTRGFSAQEALSAATIVFVRTLEKG